MTNRKNADEFGAGSGGRDRYLGELHQDVREIRTKVDDVATGLAGLAGEWKNFKWVIVVAIGLGTALIGWLSWLASGSGGGG